MKDDKVYLEHILMAISRIEEYTKNVKSGQFMKDTLIQDGVIRQIEVIGEASKLVSDGLKSGSKEIQWKDIAGMRDKLIHAYFGVDIEAVWSTVKRDIPLLKKEIKQLL